MLIISKKPRLNLAHPGISTGFFDILDVVTNTTER
nr:MAG TPA: hypothetical protein [Caudoviricetes sp.]